VIHKNKDAAPGGVRRPKETVDCGRREDFTTTTAQGQYSPAAACAFLFAVREWHRDIGLVRAATLADARRYALFYAFAEAAVHRFTGAERLDRVYMPTVIVGHTRHARAARILAADAREIAVRADAVAADFVDQLMRG
jgi:hypothetical protein